MKTFLSFVCTIFIISTNSYAQNSIVQKQPLNAATPKHYNANLGYNTAGGYYIDDKKLNDAFSNKPGYDVNAVPDNSLYFSGSENNVVTGNNVNAVNQVRSANNINAVNELNARERVKIYPNPSSTGQVSVTFTGTNINNNILLVDMNGRSIREWNAVSNNRIDISNLKKGVYALIIRDKQYNIQFNKKIVVE